MYKANLHLGQLDHDVDLWRQTDATIITGHWVIEIQPGVSSRMYGDEIVLEALGATKETTPEECYRIWQENVFSSHVAAMQRAVNQIIDGTMGDITYPWKSPTGQTLYLRSCGIRDMGYQKGVRLVGTFQNVTNVIKSEMKSRENYVKSDFLLQILSHTFEAVHVLQFDTDLVMPIRAILPLFWNERVLDIQRYKEILSVFAPEDDCQKIIECIDEKKAMDKAGNPVISCSWNFINNSTGKDRWYNVYISLDPNISTDAMVIAFRDITELEEQRKEVTHLKRASTMDGLTQVQNRIAIEQEINQHIAENPDEIGLVLLLDLDNFKLVNDQFGHQEGDSLLIETATKLKTFCRSTDRVGRLGGDEFIVFLRSVEEKDAEPLVERIIQHLKKEYNNSGTSFEVTTSIGIAHYPKDGKTFSELYRCADVALYDAKNRGKNCFCRYEKK